MIIETLEITVIKICRMVRLSQLPQTCPAHLPNSSRFRKGKCIVNLFVQGRQCSHQSFPPVRTLVYGLPALPPRHHLHLLVPPSHRTPSCPFPLPRGLHHPAPGLAYSQNRSRRRRISSRIHEPIQQHITPYLPIHHQHPYHTVTRPSEEQQQ